MASAVTQVGSTDKVVLARNPVEAVLQTTDKLSSAGTAAEVVVSITADPTEGNTLNITWNGGSAAMVFSGTDTFDGLRIPLLTSEANRKAYGDTVKQWLLKNVAINAAISISNTSTVDTTMQVTLTFKTGGNTLLNASSTASGFTASQTAGTEAVFNANHHLYLQVYAYTGLRSSVHELKATMEMVALQHSGTQYRGTAYLDELLRSLLGFYLPTWGQSGFFVPDGSVIRWYIRYYEEYGDPVEAKALELGNSPELSSTDPVYAYNGGFETKQWAKDKSAWLATYITGGERLYLTQQPSGKHIHPEQHDWLAFYTHATTTDIFLKVDITYADGTTHSVAQEERLDPSDPDIDPISQLTVCVGTGISQLNLNAHNPSKTIAEYTLTVTNDTPAAISTAFKYVVDNRHHEAADYLLFQNTFGFPETVWLQGYTGRRWEAQQREFAIRQTADMEPSSPQRSQHDTQARRKLVVSTGYHSKGYIKYLEEALMTADYIYIADSSLQYYVRVLRRSKATPERREQDNLWSLALELEETFTNRA